MIALLGLGGAGIPFLTTMCVAASAAVGVAVLVSLTLLPALLGAAGMRLAPGHKRSEPKPSRSRSEEHTSELQSRGHLVCRLLLEKKNRKEAGNESSIS